MYVEGELLPRLYESKGETKLSLDVTAADIKFLSERGANNAQDSNTVNEAEEETEDALPF